MMANNPYVSVASVIMGMGLIQGGFGLVNVLAPALLTNAGYGSDMIGWHAAVASTGFFLGTLIAPRIIRRIGHIRAFAVFAAINAIMALSMTIALDLWFWAITRSVMGFALSGTFTVAESWIGSKTTREMRGRVLAAYIVVYKSAMALAPLAITLLPNAQTPYDIARYFMVVSVCFSCALLPVAFTKSSSPAISQDNKSNTSIRELYHIAPTSLAVALFSSLANSSIVNLITVYTVQIGYTLAAGAICFSAIQFGNLLFQWPAGYISDRLDRRVVIIILAVCTLIISLINALLGSILPFWLLAGLLGVWGGCGMSIYAVSVAHASDKARPDQLVGVCSTILMIFSVGLIIGPLMGGLAMDWFGPNAIFYYVTAMYASLLIFVIWRIKVKAALPSALRKPFANFVATSLKLIHLDPRRPSSDNHPQA